HNPRREQNQILKAATIQRHVFHVRVIDYRADRCIRGADHRRAAFNRHGFENGPYRQGKVDRESVLDVENNIGLDECLESHLGNLKPVRSWRETWYNVDAFVIGLAGVLDASRIVYHQDVSTSDYSVGGIKHKAVDSSIGGLCRKGEG